MTIELQTNEFVRILKEASFFARSTPDIPVINAVHLEARGKDLIAVATDRFVLGASKTEIDESNETFMASLPLRQVRSIIQVAGAGRQCFSTVAVDADDKQIRIAFSSGETLTLGAEVERGVHRNWLKLLESTPVGEPSKAMELNPQLIAKFAQLQGKRSARMRVHFAGHQRPIRVTVGDSFVGVVMPIRMPDDAEMTWVAPDWVAPVSKKTAKAPARKNAVRASKSTGRSQSRKEPAA